jgi:hypothetical protein
VSENPLPTELPALLTSVLLSIEAIRRDPAPGDEDWGEAQEALETFDARQANRVHPDIAADVQSAVDEAGVALRAREVETARRALIRVGQLFDAWIRGER